MLCLALMKSWNCRKVSATSSRVTDARSGSWHSRPSSVSRFSASNYRRTAWTFSRRCSGGEVTASQNSGW